MWKIIGRSRNMEGTKKESRMREMYNEKNKILKD